MRYADAINFLYELQWFGLKLGLENTRRLAALAGHPEARLRFIHVAGTNGKGSTCAMLESVYRAAGLRVGLFTSPHLVSFAERIQVDRQPLAESQVVRLVTELQRMLGDFPPDHSPTFFEVVTVMALRHFAEQGCDLVIWETGMGGRLDATNIVTPLASVITNVQFDHEKWLGDTLAKIATEKAGIIKPGIPVLTAAEEPAALAVIRDTARRLGSPLVEVNRVECEPPPLDRVRLPLLGDHQRLNARLALAALHRLQAQLPVEAEAIQTGLRTVQWPGRLHVIGGPNGQTNLLDGAHNPAGVAALRRALEQHFPTQRPAMILGMLRDKDYRTMCHALMPAAASIHLVPVVNSRTATPEELREACLEAQPPGLVQTCASLGEALARTAHAPFRLITGSLYLIGQALEQLGASGTTARDEQRLNEWGLLAPTPAARVSAAVARALPVAWTLACAGALWAGEPVRSPAAPPEPLTLETAVQIALERNPVVWVSDGLLHAASGRALQRQAWPNPELEWSAEDWEVGRGSGLAAAKHTLGLSQALPFPGKKSLDGKVGGAEVRLAWTELMLRRAELARDVKAAFCQVLVAERVARVHAEFVRLALATATTARKRVEAGAAAYSEQLRAELQQEQAQAELKAAERELANERCKLVTLLGQPERDSLRLSGAPLESADLACLTVDPVRWLTNHPSVLAAQAGLDRANAEARRARLEAYPDVRVGVAGGRVGASDESIVQLQLAVPLPLWDRSKGKKVEARANVDIAEEELKWTEHRLRSAWRQAGQRLRTACEQAASYREQLLPKANDASRLVRTSFEEGKASFMDWLDVQRTTTDVRLAYEQRLLDLNLAWVEVQALLQPDRAPFRPWEIAR